MILAPTQANSSNAQTKKTGAARMTEATPFIVQKMAISVRSKWIRSSDIGSGKKRKTHLSEPQVHFS